MARIAPEDIATVRSRASLEDIVGRTVTLRRSGSGLSGLCPFHDERSPSFSVSPEKGYWHCLAGETRVLTEDGAFPIRELAGKTVRVLDSQGMWTDAPFSSFGVQRLWEIVVSRNGRKKVLRATDGHRWFVRKGSSLTQMQEQEILTRNLKPGMRLSSKFVRPKKWVPYAAISPFGVARGFVFGDGTLAGRGSAAYLHGEKDAALMPYFSECHEVDLDNPHRRTFHGLPRYFKTDLPPLDESPAYLLGWLAGYFAADGCVSDDGHAVLHSASRDTLEFVRTLANRIGVGTYGIASQNRLGIDGNYSDIHHTTFLTSTLPLDFFVLPKHRERVNQRIKAYERIGWVVESVRETDDYEEVYCASVPTTHSFTLEDNILTGNCFGCQESGDVFDFVMRTENLTFVEAVERIASDLNFTLTYTDGEPGAPRPKPGLRARLLEAHREAVTFYREAYRVQEEAAAGRTYLEERSFTPADIERFAIGYAPKAGGLCTHLKGLRFTDEEIITAGLGMAGDRGRLVDRFRGRLMWPIRSAAGDTIGFGARKVHPDDQGPKWLNTSETPLYKKSEVLYGLDSARKAIAADKKAVIVEGYGDVMACHLAGVPWAIAACGTAFGEEHVKTVRRILRDDLTAKIIFTFDGDAAGRNAAMRAFAVHAKFAASAFVAIADNGMDPLDLRLAQGDQAVCDLVEKAVPIVEFACQHTLSSFDLAGAEGRSQALRALVPILAQVSDPVLVEEYSRKVAGWLQLPLTTVRRAISNGSAAATRRDEAPEPAPASDPVAFAAKELLKILLQTSTALPEGFTPQWFSDPAQVRIAAVIAGLPTGLDRVAALREDTASVSLVAAYVVEPIRTGPNGLAECALRLQQHALDGRIASVRQAMGSPEADVERLMTELVGLQRERSALGK